MKKYKLLIIILTSFFLLTINSCRNSVSTDPISRFIMDPPVITGIVVTGESSPEFLSTWGIPNDKQNFDRNTIGIPSPNPTSGSTTIHYWIASDTFISIWIIKGRSSGQKENQYFSNGYLKTAPQNFSYKLFEGLRRAGNYQLELDTDGIGGYSLPDGLYRIFIEINGELMWCNMMKWSDPDNITGFF